MTGAIWLMAFLLVFLPIAMAVLICASLGGLRVEVEWTSRKRKEAPDDPRQG